MRRYPHSLVARLGYANALFQLGQFDEAGVQYDLIRAREPENYFVHWNRSLLLLQRQAFDEGWQCYEQRLLTLTDNHPRVFPFPALAREPLAGKSVLVYAEQGLGDEIMFASCFEDLLAMAGRCIIECDPKLAPIFARSFPRARWSPPRNAGCRAGWGRWAKSTFRSPRAACRASSGVRSTAFPAGRS